MGLGWDNSDAYSFGVFDKNNSHSYMGIKRPPDVWTHLMVTVDVDTQEIRFYLNGEESDSRFGHGSQSPLGFQTPLKRYGGNPYYIGVGDPRQEDQVYFSGDIGQICMWDKCLNDDEIKEFYSTDYPTPLNTKLYYDFSNVENDSTTAL